MSAVEGRWTITRRVSSASSGDDWHIAVGPDPGPDRAGVPSVPCDDAAIARAAVEVEDEINGRGAGDEFLYGMDDDVRDEFLRAVASAALRGAGEMPS